MSGLIGVITFDIQVKHIIKSGRRKIKEKYLKLYISWWQGNNRIKKGIPAISI
jgi:hypothetical protein